MIAKSLFFSAFFLLCVVLFDPAQLRAAETGKESERPKIIERIIKIEGTIEKPRVMFILPRARIWKEDPLRKSFYDDIIKPVYPEAFLKEFTRYELNNNIRR